ncbi:MAG: HEPN domain-containing protein [Chthoniobacterales bacterium]
MSPEREAIVRSWYRKAASDLAYAELGLRSGATFRAGAVYHCQQAAEKAIKALICLSGVTPPRNHDLVRLIELLLPSFDLRAFLEDAEFLTPMATEFRYPGECEQPTDAEAEMCLHSASRIFTEAERVIRENIGIS